MSACPAAVHTIFDCLLACELVRIPAELPLWWGRTKLLVLERVESQWCCPDWYEVVDRSAEGLHHGSGGSIAPETVAIVLEGDIIALADAIDLQPDNVYCFDSEYYLVLRARELLEPERWRTLPWGDYGPGNVVVVWDKFHGIDYVRGQLEASRVMSYGGDFADLEELVNRRHPPSRLPERRERPSPTSLLSAVRDDDLARVEALLAQGVSPRDLGAPDGVRALELGVSVARCTSPLLESVTSASPPVTEALLRAGVPADERTNAVFTPLQAAITQRRPEHVRVLLRYGADPGVVCGGKTAFELAEAVDPALAALLRAPP